MTEALLQSLAPATAQAAARPGATDTRSASWRVLVIFLGPALLIYVTMTAYPALRTVSDSFFSIDDPDAPQWVGLGNYRQLWADATFWRAVGNTLVWSVIAPLLDVGIGLLLALCLYAKVPFARLFRVAWFTPVLLSYVVVAILRMWIYNYDWGAVNLLPLRALGLGSLARAWLGDPRALFREAWVDSSFSTYFANSSAVVLGAVAVLTIQGMTAGAVK